MGFILKNFGSFSQIDSPPKTTTSTSVATCMGESLPVSRQSASVLSAKTGTNTSVASIKPE
ncbi:hypothetical protein D9M69_670410 [compost metagenome]